MNIFETIERVSQRYEPYHSQFLADALAYSLKADRSLFKAVWELAVPCDWEIPVEATVSSEEVVEHGRIDVCILAEKPQKRILGIEVKTDETSTTIGQLEKYQTGLEKKFCGYDVQISYLTPFNKEEAKDAAASLPTIRIFQEFANAFPRAKHISWLDVANIPWDGNELWKQHQAYVRQSISSLSELEAKKDMNRGFADFFGKEAAYRFSARLSELGITGTNITLSEFRGKPDFTKSFTNAFEILLNAPNVSRNAIKVNKFPDEIRKRFLDSDYRQIHESIFNLSKRFNFVWMQGKQDYGVRIAHKNHSSGVSLLRSDGPECLLVEKRSDS